jgi:Zn-dependent protease
VDHAGVVGSGFRAYDPTSMSTTPEDPPQDPPAEKLSQTDWPVTLDDIEARIEHRAEPTSFDELEVQMGLREPPRKPWLQRLLAPLIGLGLLLLKFGVFFLKFFGIFIAVGGYTLIWGWRFAVGFVLLILVHELGHYVEAKLQGLDPQLPVFIPFLGAYVALRNSRFDPWVNARVSLAGPIAGGAAALVCLVVGQSIESDLWLALAYTGFLLNLINLAPFWILDGGHVYRSWKILRVGGGRPDPAEARRLSWVVAVLALATAAALVLGMVAAHVPQNRL